MTHRVVMIATSYPRFRGDNVGSFMEPIAQGVAARGHEVHLVAPWHPLIARPRVEAGVTLHFFRYAPVPSLNVFGYAGAMRADVSLKAAAWAAAPLALAAGWLTARRVAREVRATVLHGHWVVPGGALALAARGAKPFVVSLHGSDVFVAERHRAVARVARRVFRAAGWVTACSDDLRRRAVALGARDEHSEVVPYGVDTARFRPDPASRERVRRVLHIDDETPLVCAAGRFVRKKGFEHLIEAVALLHASWPALRLVLAGSGDLAGEYREIARRHGVLDRVFFPGLLSQDEVGGYFAAADVVALPSVRDEAGNVDGLPNTVLEALASGTPVVSTRAGGIGTAVVDGRTGRLVAERDPAALAAAIDGLLRSKALRHEMGAAARRDVESRFGWSRVAQRFEAAYDRVASAPERA